MITSLKECKDEELRKFNFHKLFISLLTLGSKH